MDTDFEKLATALRPRLHRYCARMMGSAFDGEDVVQEALTRAAAAFSMGIDTPERWLFRIAHNAAIDAIRARHRRKDVGLEPDLSLVDASADAASRVVVAAGFVAFLPLPVPQRACVVLIDVLGYSAAETAAILATSVAAVKAALARGRAALAQNRQEDYPPPDISEEEKLRLRAYADLFNARAFDALRDLLAEDVRLDLAARLQLKGRSRVEIYFTRYETAERAWQLEPALAEGRPALLATALDDPRRHSVVLLDWRDGRIAVIRDFFYAPYIMEGLAVETL